jgi:photosystem II stability/assembly factor-like uncharacterized protein
LRLKILAVLLLALIGAGQICAQTWQRLGPEGGMVVSLATEGDEVYLGTADGHVFASKDGTQFWQLRGRVGQRLDAVVTRIVADPRERNRLFASVWYQEAGAGGGVFESDDSGKNWKLLGLEKEAVRALEIAPSKPDELVAGTRSGVFLSSDSGKTWERISPEGDEEIKNLDSLAIDPRDPQVIYAGTYHLPWLTRDGGKNWKAVIAGIIDDSDIMSLRLDETNADRVYMSACSGIYRSENQGGQWIKLQGIPYAARRTQVIVQDPAVPKTLYAGTTEGLWVTRDGGESWSRTTAQDWVVNSIAVLVGKDGGPERVVLGTEGRGIEISDDVGVTFTEANHGFTHVIVRELHADTRDPAHLLMVVERNGTELLESHDGAQSWSSVPMTGVELGKPKTLNADEVQGVLASPWGWILRFANGQFWLWDEAKKSWKEWKLFLPASTRRHSKAAGGSKDRLELARQVKGSGVLMFSQDRAVVATKEGLLICQPSGICSALKAFPSGQIRAAWTSPESSFIIVATDNKLGISSDGGKTAVWRDLPVASERVESLDVTQSADRMSIYLATDQGVYTSRKNGDWQQITNGLPAGRVEQWRRSPGIWVVNERGGGLYLSQDDGGSWKRIDEDAERSRMTGFVATPDGGILAGSESEGLLHFDLIRKP